MERADYFFGHVQINDCWDWTGTHTKDNYGRFWDGSRMVMAHRWVYEHLTQTVIGELTIDHRCTNTLCVNPDHMEPVTDAVNRARGGARFAATIAQERRTHCKRGHAFTPENTKVQGTKERVCRTCANMKRREWYRRTKAYPNVVCVA
jgi:hypothetical protein